MTEQTVAYVKLVRDEHGTIIDSENADHLVRKPLTDEQAELIINVCIHSNADLLAAMRDLVRVTEAAHSITSKD